MRFALMAVLTVGLSLAATSCKDDDKSDNNNGENMEQLESTGGEVSMEDIQLSTLISNFAEVQADELLAQSGWQSKTYEATLGLVLDESRPTVRSIEVGTIEAADERAEGDIEPEPLEGEDADRRGFPPRRTFRTDPSNGGPPPRERPFRALVRTPGPGRRAPRRAGAERTGRRVFRPAAGRP